MADSPGTRILAAVNRTEWLNLLGQNQIRFSRRRAVRVGLQPSQKEMDRVFSLAPHTNVESSVDLFVVELHPEWASAARSHPTGSSDVKILDRSMVISHRTVANENLDYYSDVAVRYGLSLGQCDFENAWIDWAIREQLISIEACTRRFLQLINRGDAWVEKRADKYKWQEVGRILLRPSTVIKHRPAHLDLLVKSCAEIADRTASTRDHQTFHIAVSIVWIELRTKKNPQRNKQTAPRVKFGIEASRSEPFGPPTSSTRETLSYLAESHPKAFTDELSPVSVSALIEIIHRSRGNDLTPERVLEILHTPSLTDEEVSLLVYATVVSVGVEKIGHLIRSFEFPNWVAPDWSEEKS